MTDREPLMKRSALLSTLLLSAALELCAWNVYMAGDSHVCSKIYPNTVEKILCREEPDVRFGYEGKIGAGFYTYNESPHLMQEIYDARPDILIVHLGTNDSFSRRFDRKKFLRDVQTFHDGVAKRLPECRFVFVTPFYNHIKGNAKPNRSTRACADALLEFARGNANVYVVDNNATHGMYFLKHRAELMRRDCVHLTEKGYEVLGEQVGNAIADIEDLWIIEEPPYLGDEACLEPQPTYTDTDR